MSNIALKKFPLKIKEKIIERLLFICSLLSIFTTIGIILVLFVETFEFFKEVSVLKFLTDKEWTPLFINKHFGILPLVCGTFLTTLIASSLAIPVGLVSAIYLSEYASLNLRNIVKPLMEILAAVPSIVYGYFALLFVAPLLAKIIPSISGFNALSSGIVMGIMIIPLVSSLSEDAIRAVPMGLREGAYAVGSTKLQVSLRIVLPSALSGITAAFILALSRAIGETMIVTIAAGLQPRLTLNPLVPIETITAYIVQVSLGDTPYGTLEYRTIFACGMSLFLLTFFLNIFSFKLKKHYKEIYE
jgi:phosphate transport system permease protein